MNGSNWKVFMAGCGRVLEALHTSDSQTSLFTLGMVKADQSKRSLLNYKSHHGGRAGGLKED